MTRRAGRRLAAVAFVLTLASLPLGGVTSAQADQPPGYGPSDPFDDALLPDDGPVEPMRDKAKIVRTDYGYRFTAAQQNSHLRITVSNDRLRFRDTRTRAWKSVPRSCRKQRVDPGVAASCRIPGSGAPHLVEVHPRLGNDWVDGRGLPASIELAVLGDAGRDTMFGGRGKDYLNGAQQGDRASGGAGKDWIRGGKARDRLYGGDDSDWIVGMSGRDRIRGGGGRDRVFQ